MKKFDRMPTIPSTTTFIEYLMPNLFSYAFRVIADLLFYIPATHISSFIDNPSIRNAVGIFVIGPIKGTTTFLLNPASVAATVSMAAAVAFNFPDVSLTLLTIMGLGANVIVGLTQNELAANKIDQVKIDPKDYKAPTNDVSAELGPFSNALLQNFRAANNFASEESKPYVDEDLYELLRDKGTTPRKR
jgi:hypothetical protein